MRSNRGWVWGLLLCMNPAAAALQIEPLTFETGERAAQPSLAVDPGAGFVLTWQERDADGTALRFAVIDSDAREQRRGTVAQGDHWFVNGADFPALAVLDNGDWVTYWLQKTAPDTYAYQIVVRRSRDRGVSWDPPVLLHGDGTDTEHGFVSLLPDGGDRVRAVWLDGRRMAATPAAHGHDEHAEHMTLRSATLGRDGVRRDEVELDDLTCACCQTDAARVDGSMVVVYRNRTGDDIRDIHRVVHGTAGWSKPAALHDDGWKIAACPVNGPAIASHGSDSAVMWPTMADGGLRVMLQLSGQTRVLAGGADELGRVDITDWAGTQWLASRVSSDQRVPTLRLSLLDGDGRVLDEQVVASRVGGFPRLARHGGVALLAWAEAGPTPGSSTVALARIVTESESSAAPAPPRAAAAGGSVPTDPRD